MTTTDLPITLNGEPTTLPEGATLPDVLRRLGREPDAKGVAIAVNDAVVRRGAWETTALAPGDRIEVITASQGG